LDALNRLVSVTPAAGLASQYTYDADGHRVAATVGANTTRYVWDERSTYGDVVAELDADGALRSRYVLGHDRLIGQINGGSASYFAADALGNTRALTDGGAGVTDTYRYDLFSCLGVKDWVVPPFYRTGFFSWFLNEVTSNE
jgi:YD repeat-containing protein